MFRLNLAAPTLILMSGLSGTLRSACPPPLPLGASPTRLVVVVPGTGQNATHWRSFLDALRKEPGAVNMAWLVYEHGVGGGTLGSARETAAGLATCIDERCAARHSRP